MRKLLRIMRLPAGSGRQVSTAHHAWIAFALTGLGCCAGLLSLLFSATAYFKLPGEDVLLSYFSNPLLIFLNLLPPVLLAWLFYLLSGQSWIGFLGSYLPTVGLAAVNYFKIRLRSDPLLASDLRLFAEAEGIVGHYTLDITWLIWLALGCLLAGLVFAVVLMPRGVRGWLRRLSGGAFVLCLMGAALFGLYLNPAVYQKTANEKLINPWSDVEVFVSKGFAYPFLHSVSTLFPAQPQGYNAAEANAVLARYKHTDIQPEQRISIMGVMLEAFSDMTQFEALSQNESVEQVYAPWRKLQAEGVSGNLLTNVFAGGTVDTEWSFLTGYSQFDEFRFPIQTYVRYLAEQGYQTFGSHPGYGWFYNRQNVNLYLGFAEYWFTENHYSTLIDPFSAPWTDSDAILFSELLGQLETRIKHGPCFSFSVSYQNHGPYESGYTARREYVTPKTTGLSQESSHILNNYLKGVDSTLQAVDQLKTGLENMAQPVVLVLFGDHKPWGGNGNSLYADMGATFDLSALSGFYDYYATPYVLWANPAARAILGATVPQRGGDISPCFLMNRVFDLCGWAGPRFMQLSRQMEEITPLLHARGLFLADGALTDTLPAQDSEFLQQYLGVEFALQQERLSKFEFS